MKVTRWLALLPLFLLACDDKGAPPASSSQVTAAATELPLHRGRGPRPVESSSAPPLPAPSGKIPPADSPCARAGGPCEGEGILGAGGRDRRYRFHLPAEKDGKLGLVMALHGHGADASSLERVSHFDRVANQYGFIVVYPEGVEKSWNSADSKTAAAKAGVDDVAFVSALIDHFVAHLDADPDRVIVAGFSNGGEMSERIGCELSDKVTAIAPVSGTMADEESGRCKPKKPISVIMFHGDADKTVPFDGKQASPLMGKLLSAPDTIARWAALNHCGATPTTMDEKDADPDDGTKVKRITYPDCASGVRVMLFKIEGGVHAWPLGPDPTGKKSAGDGVCRDIDASDRIWQMVTNKG